METRASYAPIAAASYLRHFRILDDPIDVLVDFVPEALA
jgi:hypothetical protein